MFSVFYQQDLTNAGTGFAVVLPLPLVFDPPLYILHFTIYTTFHREATLKTVLELLDAKQRADNNTHYSPSKSITECIKFTKRAELWIDFWQLDDIFEPLVGTNSLYEKRTVGFFSLASHPLRACEARALRARKTRTPSFTDFFTDLDEKNNCFAV